MPNNISYTSIVSILVKEINKTRNQPKSLIPLLEERIKKYDKDNKYYPLKGLNFSVGTRQGASGVEDLIEFLNYSNQVPPLTWSYQLHLAAERRCAAICSNEQNETVLLDRTVQTAKLVSEYARWQDNLIEMTFYGFIEPIEFISELLLEDAQKNKENRIEFFNKYNKFIGISIHTHQKFRYAIVIILASQVLEKKVFKVDERKHSDSIIQVSEEVNCGNDCQIY